MYKGVKKIKIKKGRDSNRSIVRKLLTNFIIRGKLTTTVKRAKIVRSKIDRLVSKAKFNTQADKNVLLRELGNNTIIKKLLTDVIPVIGNRTSGFTKQVRTGRRLGDGAEMIQLTWTDNVVLARVKTDQKDKSAKVDEKQVPEEKKQEVQKSK